MEIEAIWWETLAPLAVLSGVKFSPVLWRGNARGRLTNYTPASRQDLEV
jgi:hypothetical protein